MPLSILHLVNSLAAGGAERVVAELALAQRAAGHKVAVVPFSSAEAVYDSSGLAGERIAALRANGVVVRIPHYRMVLPATLTLKRLIAETGPDIVHNHIMIGLVLLRLTGRCLPVVATHHSTPLPAGRLLSRVITGRAQAFVAVNRVAVPILNNVFRGPVEVIQNGISDHSRPHVPKPANEPLRIISVGQMRPAKNYLQLVEIAYALKARGVRAQFRIVGDGSEHRAVKARVAALGLEDEVVLLGTRKDVPELLARSDVYLLTSKWEGMPIALIEALQAGLPIITADVGGCAELVGTGGDASFVVPVGEIGTFVDRLEQLAADPNLRATMGRAARARASAFGIAATAEAYEALYRRVLCGRAETNTGERHMRQGRSAL